MPSTRSNQQIISTNAIEIEYEYPSSTVADSTTSAMVRFVMSNNPPLSNFEQKQLAEALMKHPKGDALTLDEAQSFINEKATDIGKYIIEHIFIRSIIAMHIFLLYL